ncbi:hypothetical protein [Flavilitoribacter nigricans]|uniref:Calx-beta domain-containing protein n=1 Tax=Flavilitoribacter nigricans (strain ATCC 23147 / DSM 23189 / NBRC 102662 / NCIMB 1420 / SS-2) TaxID=1122177 RepID=A0A2D0N4M9_FLAN2|nr:hypothetical protein [Flavilitoribacter nigricans]PHN03387.1 hypothetical protein CRP01_27270 [Flavilitoribacter nigricans DSM 23189 = NBRC 102662]
MTLKNSISFLLLVALLVGFSACEETKYDITPYTGDNFYRFTSSGTAIFEDDPMPIEIPVRYSTTDGSSGSVEFEISGGAAGTDYEILNSSNTLSFDAGSGYQDVIRIQPVYNQPSASDAVLEITLTNPQNGVAGFPGPDGNNSTYLLTIKNECTRIPVGGTYVSLTTGQSTDGCCPDEVANHASVVTITDNGDGTYEVSDFSAGLYLEWYDVYGVTADLPLPVTLTVDGSVVTISGSEPFGTSVSGSGTYEKCSGAITYTWSNGYSDTGTVSLTLQQ